MTERDALDMQIRAGGDVSIDAVKAALTGDSPPNGDLRPLYAQRLLAHALEKRDAEAAHIIARLMDDNPDLDRQLYRLLNDRLYVQPDEVYAFVRAHLNERINPRWLPRLKAAAVSALRVAITEGDADTVMNWLTLIAREPANFELADVLHDGILAAAGRAHTDGNLGRQLIALAAKRDPVALGILLKDDDLMAALPDNSGRVFRTYDGDALATLQNRGQETFAVALARAARARAGQMFTPDAIVKLWDIYTAAQTSVLPPEYQVSGVIQELVEHGYTFVSPEALQTLMALIINSRRDDLLLTMLSAPDAARILLPGAIQALENSDRSMNDRLELTGRMLTAGILTPQGAADACLQMAADKDWNRDALPLMQQFARLLQQHPTIHIDTDTLWKLLNVATDAKDELIARAVSRRLLTASENLDEDQLAENMRRLNTELSWSEVARATLENWWRGFIRTLHLNRLQKLDKALEGRRALEDERNILQTLIALRRMIGGRKLEEFADEVHRAYTLLEAIAESFDPTPKRTLSFDPVIVQNELSNREDQITQEERQILANDLRELAGLIANMGDNRTKANLMRRGDDLDRDLMSGEQPPHSAVDAMKWLAGFWGGTQEDDEEEE
jgi:hypothetical protein